jgi:hypothetical protein
MRAFCWLLTGLYTGRLGYEELFHSLSLSFSRRWRVSRHPPQRLFLVTFGSDKYMGRVFSTLPI